jgi:hypothetical protein
MAGRYGTPRPLASAVAGRARAAGSTRQTRHAVILVRDGDLQRLLACQLQDCFVAHFVDASESATALATRLPRSDLIIIDSELADSIGPLVRAWPEAICVLMSAGPSSSELRALGTVVHLIIARPPAHSTLLAINHAVMSLTDD